MAMEGSDCLRIDRAVVPIDRRYRRRALSWRLRGRRQASAHLLPFERFGPPLVPRGGCVRKDVGKSQDMKMPNKTLHATATVLSDFVRARKHNTVVAVARALPVAVPELGR